MVTTKFMLLRCTVLLEIATAQTNLHPFLNTNTNKSHGRTRTRTRTHHIHTQVPIRSRKRGVGRRASHGGKSNPAHQRNDAPAQVCCRLWRFGQFISEGGRVAGSRSVGVQTHIHAGTRRHLLAVRLREPRCWEQASDTAPHTFVLFFWFPGGTLLGSTDPSAWRPPRGRGVTASASYRGWYQATLPLPLYADVHYFMLTCTHCDDSSSLLQAVKRCSRAVQTKVW